MTKLIFLDIDGVLNHQLFYEERCQSTRYKEVGYPDCDLDPEKIKLLNSLIKDTGAKVVISSTWRRSTPLNEIIEVMERLGFKGEIIGVTPVLTYHKHIGGTVPRGCEIKAYLDDLCKDQPIRYVIFDDDGDMLLWQRENFFQVDGFCGLTPTIVYKAKNFLNKD